MDTIVIVMSAKEEEEHNVGCGFINHYDDYRIEQDGRVYSLKSCKYLKPRYKKGYAYVRLYNKKGNKEFAIHRLVLMAWKPRLNPENFEVNHINGVKDDNRLKNLEWCNREENVQHAKSNNLYKKQAGEENHNSKLTSEQVAQIIELIALGYNNKQIAQQLNNIVTHSTVSAIRRGKLWRENS